MRLAVSGITGLFVLLMRRRRSGDSLAALLGLGEGDSQLGSGHGRDGTLLGGGAATTLAIGGDLLMVS